MAEEGKGIALVILGIVAIVAVIGLVLMFTQGGAPVGQYGYPHGPATGVYGEQGTGARDPCRALTGSAYVRCREEVDRLGPIQVGYKPYFD